MLQFLGSLAAILLLARTARWLHLGPQPKIESPEAAKIAAQEAHFGFAPERLAIDREGRGAIFEDASGRLLVLKPHGSKFAARLLGPQAQARLWLDLGMPALEVDCGEARFGKVFLDLADSEPWVAAINALNKTQNA